MPVALDETNDVEDVTDRVSNRVGGAIPLDAVRARVRRNFSAFRDATVRQFVPVFVERRVRAELRG
jgi:hypothetical protein